MFFDLQTLKSGNGAVAEAAVLGSLERLTVFSNLW